MERTIKYLGSSQRAIQYRVQYKNIVKYVILFPEGQSHCTIIVNGRVKYRTQIMRW